VVRVKAISVNPVDTKIRAGRAPKDVRPVILGWDAVGIVESTGPDAKTFSVGDRVYYAGAIDRPGANSELHAVDERIIARAPRSLTDEDRLRIARDGGDGETLLIIGGAGGVGSILIQLARTLTKLRVVATASRPETQKWCFDLGAHCVIDHRKPLAPQLEAAGFGGVEYVASLTHTEQHLEQIVECLKPQGHLAVIDDMDSLNAMKLKSKSLSLHWELMFTRTLYQTADMSKQGELLAEISALVDAGRLRTTLSDSFGRITAENLRRAHALIESNRAQGKIVLAGF
jgi:zinc-binding alcohol dehydrogenase family protein